MEERQSATRKILERLKQDENLKGSMGGKRTFNWSMRHKIQLNLDSSFKILININYFVLYFFVSL